MAVGTLAVVAGSVLQTNTQTEVQYDGQLQASAFADTYPAGGFALDSVLLAALIPTGTLRYVIASETGSGYIYQRIPSTGKLMVLQVPVNGSLTTAAPLNQLPSSTNSMSGVFNDVIRFVAVYKRNA